jgi:hypothetical protein
MFKNEYFELIESLNIRFEYSYEEEATKRLTQVLYERTRMKENCIHDKFASSFLWLNLKNK